MSFPGRDNISHGLSQVVVREMEGVLPCDPTGRRLLEACTGFLQTLPHEPFAFADLAL